MMPLFDMIVTETKTIQINIGARINANTREEAAAWAETVYGRGEYDEKLKAALPHSQTVTCELSVGYYNADGAFVRCF